MSDSSTHTESDSTPATKRPTLADSSAEPVTKKTKVEEPKVNQDWDRNSIFECDDDPLYEFKIDVMETEDPEEHRLVLKMIELALERYVANSYKFEKLLKVLAGFALGGGFLCIITFEAISIEDATIAKFKTESISYAGDAIEINTWKKLD